MQLNILALAIPLFVSLMLIEYLVAKRRGHEYFQLHNSIANVSIGIAERMSEVLIAGLFYFVYDSLQKNYGLFEIQPGVFLWILGGAPHAPSTTHSPHAQAGGTNTTQNQ